MKLIVGLGNPGEDYELTRHNAGRMVVDQLLREKNLRLKRKDEFSYALIEMVNEQVILVRPSVFMNASGLAVKACAAHFDCVKPQAILVVADDVHLPIGQIRLRTKGSAGGHHGVESVISELHTSEFPRLRIGIGREGLSGTDLTGYVLGGFEPEERRELEEVLVRAGKACLDWACKGSLFSMNHYN